MLLDNRPGYTDGPFLHHDDLFAGDLGDGFLYSELALLDLLDLTLYVDRDEDPVLHGSFHDRSDNLSRGDLVADCDCRLESPFLLSVQSRCGDSPQDVVSHFLLQDRQRPLNSVINGVQKSRTEFRNKRTAGVSDRFSRFDAGRILINLDD